MAKLLILAFAALFLFLLPSSSQAITQCEAEGGRCVRSNYVCTRCTNSSQLSCNSGYRCVFCSSGWSCAAPSPTPTRIPDKWRCNSDGTCSRNVNGFFDDPDLCRMECSAPTPSNTPPPTPIPSNTPTPAPVYGCYRPPNSSDTCDLLLVPRYPAPPNTPFCNNCSTQYPLCCGDKIVFQNVCIPRVYTCVDSTSGSYMLRCNIDGSGYDANSRLNCGPNQRCDLNNTSCVDLAIASAATCTNGQTTCIDGFRHRCVDGDWMPTSAGGGCTPPPNSGRTGAGYGGCPIVNGVAFCKQTDPAWGDEPFPGGCPNLNSDGTAAGGENTDRNQLKRMGCGPSVACSILCNYVDSKYCNVPDCMSQIANLKNLSCNGIGANRLYRLLTGPEFQSRLTAVYIRPPTQTARPVIDWGMVDSSGNPINYVYRYFTKTDLKNHLKACGKLLVSGIFTPDNNANGQYEYNEPHIDHNSLAVGIDAQGDIIWNDPYFNSANSNPLYQKDGKLAGVDVLPTEITCIQPLP